MTNKLAVLSCILLVLTACSGGKEPEKKQCPESLILSGLSKDLRSQTIAGGKIDIDLARLYPDCNCNGRVVKVNPNPIFTAVRADDERSEKISSHYFIALVDDQDQILTKKTYKVAFDFSAGESRKREHKPSPLSFELDEDQDPENLRVYVGFQLNPELYTQRARI